MVRTDNSLVGGRGNFSSPLQGNCPHYLNGQGYFFCTKSGKIPLTPRLTRPNSSSPRKLSAGHSASGSLNGYRPSMVQNRYPRSYWFLTSKRSSTMWHSPWTGYCACWTDSDKGVWWTFLKQLFMKLFLIMDISSDVFSTVIDKMTDHWGNASINRGIWWRSSACWVIFSMLFQLPIIKHSR